VPYALHAVRGFSEDFTGVSTDSDVRERIRNVINNHARLPIDVASLGDDIDLFQAGMTSHASVNVMLGLETEFDVEFPDSMLKRSVFQSVSAIDGALRQLLPLAAA
jgi:acyl carrier protein